MSEDIFERISKLVDQYQTQYTNKQASEVRKRAKDSDWSEYDVGKSVPLKDFPLQKEMEELLSEYMPNNPTVSSVEEGSEQSGVEDAYPSAPNPEVASEELPDVPIDKPLGGNEAMKDASQLSDRELLGKLAGAAYEILRAYALIEPSKRIIKSGALGKDLMAAYTVADIVKQADYDADLLVGCLYGIKQAADQSLEEATAPDSEEAGEDPVKVLAEASPEEIQEVLEENPELAAAIAQQGAAVSPEAVLAEASPEEIQEVLEENPELAAALVGEAGAPAEDPIQVLAEASPEEIQEVLEENPELAAAIAEQAAAVAQPVAEDPVQVLAGASPEEIQKVLDENPELAAALAPVLEEAEAQEGSKEAPESKEMQKLEDVLGTEKHEEEPSAKEETKESSVLAKLAALSRVLEEENLTPEELSVYLAGTSKEKDGIKVANAVRNFRNKFKGKVIKEAESPALKDHMRKFLQELLIG